MYTANFLLFTCVKHGRYQADSHTDGTLFHTESCWVRHADKPKLTCVVAEWLVIPITELCVLFECRQLLIMVWNFH